MSGNANASGESVTGFRIRDHAQPSQRSSREAAEGGSPERKCRESQHKTKPGRDRGATALRTILGAKSAIPDDPKSSRYPTKLLRWCKFNVVGGIGIAVQFASLFLLKNVLHLHYLAATALAVEAAVLHNFCWHEHYTWADRYASRRPSLQRLVRFHLANGAVSIVGNLALMKVMVGQGHMNYLVANGFAICLCSLANFLVSEEWVFEQS